jgi:hypothetical protein
MKGMKAKLTSSETANDPDSRINKSLRAWNCRADGGRLMDDDIMHALRIAQNRMGYADGGDVASAPSALDTSVDDQDYSNYINQMLTNLTNNSNFNTPPAMSAPQIDVAQMSAPNPSLAMPPAGMNQPPMGGMGAAGQGMSKPFAPPSQDLSSQLANAGFSSQQVNSIMQILQGGQQGQGQGMARPFAPGPMMPGQGIAPTLAMPPQGGFPATAGVQNNPAMSGMAANPAAAPAAPAPAAGIPMPGMGQ